MILIIPARGGSKRIPRKNIRPFLGAPILTYPILVAQESGLFSRIVVSTDDDEIRAIAVSAGASAHRRPGELARDTASVESVCRDVLECGACFDGYERFACTFPTSVFTTVEHWKLAAIKLECGWPAVYSARYYSPPIYRAMDSNGWVFPEFKDSRTQDCPEAWHDAGQFYMLAKWAPSFLDVPGRAAIMLSRAVDIDEPEDWPVAEALYREMHK